MEFSGYKTVHPIELIWRDALEVVKQLFSDPIFMNHMTYTLHIVNVGNKHEYGDYMSADMAWRIQDHLPVGATQVPIILGSDKTHVTRITRGLEMHPVFITIGNINLEFHMHSDYQSILQAWLWHKCMDLVLANLKAMALDGCFMPDSSRYIHYVFTPLIAHICDLLEASMITTVAKNASPVTMAVQEDFGNRTLHPPCTGEHTLQQLIKISHKVDPWDLDNVQKAAKAVNLSCVHMPYWHDWIYACPSIFLTGEILHTCFKFFADHPLKWVKEAVGAYELDNHFIVQHKRVSTHHFTKGIMQVKQMTGCEYRDIQCTIVASIAGATSPQFIRTICAIVEFIYLTQNPVHSSEMLQSMEQALSNFHFFKGAIIEAEARKGKGGVKDNFFIPKLKLLQSFKADMMEHLLITHCKDLFQWTAQQGKDFTEQCMWILNHQEAMEIFNLYALLTSHGAPLVNAMCAEEDEVATTNPMLSWVSQVLPDEVKSVHGP
ncbi:uncharacterized protein BJ212DRAFT_1449051 [Suillus subaureus]|uniref:Uncharacterized protein n=1 Tax=Suillus subaureus TaxID=48587 RepID=A0A9P7E1H4_9AGAM|nr:uncharacterized protein BJ212DRAFT_1449051 [Suillus subaureus]KAG1808426.1 hypothetical protein BJ212DRAFT_1449051 [Suillus subaureus]